MLESIILVLWTDTELCFKLKRNLHLTEKVNKSPAVDISICFDLQLTLEVFFVFYHHHNSNWMYHMWWYCVIVAVLTCCHLLLIILQLVEEFTLLHDYEMSLCLCSHCIFTISFSMIKSGDCSEQWLDFVSSDYDLDRCVLLKLRQLSLFILLYFVFPLTIFPGNQKIPHTVSIAYSVASEPVCKASGAMALTLHAEVCVFIKWLWSNPRVLTHVLLSTWGTGVSKLHSFVFQTSN